MAALDCARNQELRAGEAQAEAKGGTNSNSNKSSVRCRMQQMATGSDCAVLCCAIALVPACIASSLSGCIMMMMGGLAFDWPQSVCRRA